MKALAAGLMMMTVTLAVPVRESTTVPVMDAVVAWTTDGAVAEVTAHDGLVVITGRAVGRARIMVESASGASELEVVVVGAEGEPRSGEVRTGTIELFEGDIVLEDLDRPDVATQGAAITGSRYRWPKGTIPFTIDPALPDKARVTAAIAHWEASTNCRFAPRTNEPDFVTFRAGSGCSSAIGRRRGQQFITLDGDCMTGSVVHEIGHTVGLWHEQSREDRDRFVRIDFTKIRRDSLQNFNQHVSDGDDVGPYDYASIMHYPRSAYSIDGSDTIVPLDPKARIGQRDGLSAGDVAAANALCSPEPAGKRRAVR